MKLLYCDNCQDIVRVGLSRWRTCFCGRVGGQYNEDGVTATIGGPARVFGIANPFFMPGFAKKTPQEIFEIRTRYKYEGTEIWWGGGPSDTQLLWIKSPLGPRLTHKQAMDRVRRLQKKLGKLGTTPGEQFGSKQLSLARKQTQKWLMSQRMVV